MENEAELIFSRKPKSASIATSPYKYCWLMRTRGNGSKQKVMSYKNRMTLYIIRKRSDDPIFNPQNNKFENSTL